MSFGYTALILAHIAKRVAWAIHFVESSCAVQSPGGVGGFILGVIFICCLY